jgi:hypothetical protein
LHVRLKIAAFQSKDRIPARKEVMGPQMPPVPVALVEAVEEGGTIQGIELCGESNRLSDRTQAFLCIVFVVVGMIRIRRMHS